MTTPPSHPRLRSLACTLSISALLMATGAFAQEARPAGGQGGRGPGGPEGERGPMRVNPVVAALDTNGDGTLSAGEIAAAPAALKKLDKNGDGQLTQDELRPAFGRGGPGGPGQSPEDMVKRLLEFDKNADGKLTRDELPERMQGMIERADTDKDGSLSKAELTTMAQAQAAAAAATGGGGGREGRGRDGGERRRPGGENRQ